MTITVRTLNEVSNFLDVIKNTDAMKSALGEFTMQQDAVDERVKQLDAREASLIEREQAARKVLDNEREVRDTLTRQINGYQEAANAANKAEEASKQARTKYEDGLADAVLKAQAADDRQKGLDEREAKLTNAEADLVKRIEKIAADEADIKARLDKLKAVMND